jgi:hypothetical protein
VVVGRLVTYAPPHIHNLRSGVFKNAIVNPPPNLETFVSLTQARTREKPHNCRAREKPVNSMS